MTATLTGPSPVEGLPTQRVPYEKPKLRSISLVGEQVLGVGCKLVNVPFAAFGAPFCFAVPCSEPGT